MDTIGVAESQITQGILELLVHRLRDRCEIAPPAQFSVPASGCEPKTTRPELLKTRAVSAAYSGLIFYVYYEKPDFRRFSAFSTAPWLKVGRLELPQLQL
jgi:hypothetical protein